MGDPEIPKAVCCAKACHGPHKCARRPYGETGNAGVCQDAPDTKRVYRAQRTGWPLVAHVRCTRGYLSHGAIVFGRPAWLRETNSARTEGGGGVAAEVQHSPRLAARRGTARSAHRWQRGLRQYATPGATYPVGSTDCLACAREVAAEGASDGDAHGPVQRARVWLGPQKRASGPFFATGHASSCQDAPDTKRVYRAQRAVLASATTQDVRRLI